MKTVFIGLGSNIENREQNLRIAMQLLAPDIQIQKRSSMWESEAMYFTQQPDFLNMVVEAKTILPTEGVFTKIKAIQEEMGTHEHNMPRVIDLDILFYADEMIDTPQLTVPHPKIAERAFVLAPMEEIAADFIHPLLNLSIAELVKRLGDLSKRVKKYENRE